MQAKEKNNKVINDATLNISQRSRINKIFTPNVIFKICLLARVFLKESLITGYETE